MVWAYLARGTGDPEMARQLAARALRRVFASLADFDGRGSLGGFALRYADEELRALKGDACPPIRGEKDR